LVAPDWKTHNKNQKLMNLSKPNFNKKEEDGTYTLPKVDNSRLDAIYA